MDAAALREDAQSVVLTLTTIGKTLATAESCTGGLLGALLTDIPGASNVYLGGVVTYAYSAKEALLGVDAAVLERDGAVCETVARQMAEGIRKKLDADYGIGITGNAGPSSDPKNPNVGEIFVACAETSGTRCLRMELKGNRAENRKAACSAALHMLLPELMREA